MVSLFTLIKLTVLLTTNADGILSLTITGQPSVNGTFGGDVNITWKIKNIVHASFSIHVNNSDYENEIFRIHIFSFNNNRTFSASVTGKHDNIRKRSSASYYYTEHSGGNETGQVVLTITNLKLEDSGRFVLLDGHSLIINAVTSVLSVQYGPEKCGLGLKSEYIVIPGDQLMVTSGFCGTPQLRVTCTINGTPRNNIVISEVSQYKYTYEVSIPNLESCSKRELQCTVTGYGSPFIDSTIVHGRFNSNVASYVRNIAFTRHCDTCSTVSWEKEDSTGQCDVHHQLQFFNGTNATATSVFLKGNSYSNCSLQFESVKVTTSVYGTLNGAYKLLNKRTSDIVKLYYKSCTTTTATIATTAADVDTLRSELNGKAEEVHSKTVINIALGVIIALFIILMLLFIILIKAERLKVNFIQHSKPKNVDQKYQENIQDINTTVKPPSDYMELEAARKDTTYQTLTSVQSTPGSAKDNSAYEVYYKKR